MSDLLLAARQVRERAYARYSQYPVGAAILSSSGKIYTGCNVENSSLGLTMCAEMVAIGGMVSAGETSIRCMALSTVDGGTPCGRCRQILAEFALDPEQVEVHCQSDKGETKIYTLAQLLPFGFEFDPS